MMMMKPYKVKDYHITILALSSLQTGHQTLCNRKQWFTRIIFSKGAKEHGKRTVSEQETFQY